ncbi:hypothetical protein L6164_025161 [Bauhinia variegata]|uniref:Uncharacterized protein n=1 Tax=Bauhinia variegata TaxID=167791 RepID=A0ACB9LZR3_BAUVA|nr:hypothetical protein L6164_025161 [Bauhinia variegata]
MNTQNSNGISQIPSGHAVTRISHGQDPNGSADPLVPLRNLLVVRTRMDSLQGFLSESINSRTLVSKDQMEMVSNEIVSAIHQIIVNGTALVSAGASMKLLDSSDVVSCKKPRLDSSSKQGFDLKVEVLDDEDAEDCEDDCEIVELDAMELLMEHIHFCEICGKGFRRDANLRMHMRSHGNQFKTPEALAKPSDKLEGTRRRATRFSCPFEGCNRNKSHKKFRPLKSIICVKNHFKRSHCPKMYSCNRCHKKNFSVLSDLKSHQKHCGESRWKCSCGTTFSRKDKLFGHIALFEGHMPALAPDEEEKGKPVEVVAMVDDERDRMLKEDVGVNHFDDGLPDGFFDDLDAFGSIENYCLQRDAFHS